MNQHSFSTPAFRRKALAGILLPLLVVAGGAAKGGGAGPSALASPAGASAAQADTVESAQAGSTQPVYSVINLAPPGTNAHLNEKGQVAFSGPSYVGAGFYDGVRVHDMGSLAGGIVRVADLNNRGVIAGTSAFATDPLAIQIPFTWTVAGGYRVLPGPRDGTAQAINDRNQVAGTLPIPDAPYPGIPYRAVRWEPDGTIVPLGPVPALSSWPNDINNAALAGGNALEEDVLATLWGRDGRALSLGPGQVEYVNEKGDAAGYRLTSPDGSPDVVFHGFFRGAGSRLVWTGAQAGIEEFPELVTNLNDRGEIVGNTSRPGGAAAYLWSRARGLVLLPRGPAVATGVADVNNHTQMVGRIALNTLGERAALWRGLSKPIDLNELVYRRPPGLVLTAGLAINDAGAIVAASNAGLVLLRPGKTGSDAPVLGPVNGLPDIVTVGQEVRPTLGFIGTPRNDGYRAVAEWTDGCVSPHPLVRSANGVGEVRLQHRFCVSGPASLTLRVIDSAGRSTRTSRRVFVSDPAVAAVSGQGALARPAGAGGQALRFAFWAPIGGQAGTGADRATVEFQGPFTFASQKVFSVVREGRQVRLEGSGQFNGRAGYRFLVEAVDGGAQNAGSAGSGDRLRVRIVHTGAAGKEVVDYDSAPAATGAAAPAAAAAQVPVAEGAIALNG